MSTDSMSPILPAVLQGRGKESSISMERALKQVLRLLAELDAILIDDALYDDVAASIDDVKMMLAHIAR